MPATTAGRKPVFERIASELRTRINDGLLDSPKTMRELADVWQVSVRTMGKAIHILAHEGIINCVKGRPLRRAGIAQTTQPLAESRFYDIVKSRILNGTYRWNKPLPKVNYFIATEQVSPNTVSAVCAQLSKEKLIHKKGKQWIIGTSEAEIAATGFRRRPTILLLFRVGTEWQPFFSHAWVAAYSAPFASELQLLGRETFFGFLDKSEIPQEIPVPAGSQELVAYAKSLGDSYQGTHVYLGIDPPLGTAVCVTDLLRLGKPVVFFDHNDLHANFVHELPAKLRKQFFRFYQNEDAAILLALTTLIAHRHSRIGVLTYSSPKLDWIPRRVQRILAAVKQLPQPPEIMASEQHESFWRYDKEFDLSLYAEHIAQVLGKADQSSLTAPIKHTSLREQLRAGTPSIMHLLEKGVTAFIALNDGMARELYIWAKYAGFTIPDDFSVISFDNSVDCRNIPVTTIDFGFAQLGYLAAHAIIGDIPVPSDSLGNVPGVCTVVDRGSIRAA